LPIYENSAGEKNKWKWLSETYPAIAKYLEQFSADAEIRYDKGDYWWELRACDYYPEFEKPKMMLPDISLRSNFSIDKDGIFYCVNTAYIIGKYDLFLIGVLNSRLISLYYRMISPIFRGGYLRFIYQYLIQIPIRTIDFTNPKDVARHDRMVSLVETMLDLNKKLDNAKLGSEKEMIQRRIDATNDAIDKLVYELYGLSAKEIAIVESS
ncbi:MAG: TaqI-like C-terminal specificity domain-containing protein, partial [Methanomicrobium sp.]|nr:TaqI-like C-terminal specificity domain-containing protein [Methanomicrobium sp.]